MTFAHSSTNLGDNSELPPKADAVDSPASSAGAEVPDRESADDRVETLEEQLQRLNAHEPGALHQAAEDGKVSDVKFLIQHGRSVHEMDEYSDTVLHKAAERGRVHVIVELLHSGAEVDARSNFGETALHFATRFGHLGAVQELIKHGAAVNVASNDGRTPLHQAAVRNRNAAVIRELIKNGADVHATDMNGWAALHLAAAEIRQYSDVVVELLASGADPATKTKDGRTALSFAVKRGNAEIVRELLRASFFDKDTNTEERVELFKAATMGYLGSVEKLIEGGESINATTTDGRTPLFYAVELGRMDVVKSLLKLGASVAKQSLPNDSSLGGETPLTLAGRAGHMKIFEELIKAGAPVNVRSRDNGETPLISAARWDFAAGVQLLLSSGDALRDDDIPEADKCPLIPSTLKTMKSLCFVTFEFESMCRRVVARLQSVCAQLHQLDPANVQEGAFVTFANILFRFCRLQLEIKKRQTPLSRFIGSRAITSKIYDFHEELDHFGELLGLAASPTGATAWKAQYIEDQSDLSKQFGTKLADDEVLMSGYAGKKKHEAVILLQAELVAHAREGNTELQVAVRKVRDRFLKLSKIEAPVLPAWFISREDVEMHSWRPVWLGYRTMHYEGEWRKTNVRIETYPWPVHESASRWFEMSHPNVVNLLGACNIGEPFFVYELVPGGRHLLDFLHEGNKSNRGGAVWKCLYQAALGLRYMHNRGLVHGKLRPEHILVGSNLLTKLIGLHEVSKRFGYDDGRPLANWMGSEFFKQKALPSAAPDIYAFGMCIWAAVTLELPWKDMDSGDIYKAALGGKLPERPSIMTDDEWDLITKMCKHDPTERVDIDFVVNRLEKFVFDSEQRSKADDTQRFSEVQSQSVKEHVFGELGGATIPEALKSVAYKCDRLPVEDQWMSKSVFPALEYIFGLLQQQQKTGRDVEAVQFCTALSRFQRHLRTAVSENSTRRYARSRKVAESNGVIYSELDRLLDMLDVSAEDPIRQWKHKSPSAQQHGADSTLSTSDVLSDSPGGDVSVVYFDSPSMNHELWTQASLKASQCAQSWTLPLKDLLFSDSDQISKGAFGEVFKGSWLGTPVVVKFMGYEDDEDTIPTDLLLHEVRVWHRLNHPHVLRLYGANYQDKRYFVCEFASGGDLLDFLEKPGKKKLAWQKLYETALGLQYLHGQNVAHNDLKCDNIMVGMDGNAKLIDFGLSCLLNKAEIRIDVKKMGAVHWRSPEYLAGERPSFASDVYSFAMCIIEAISGEIPWGKSMIPAVVKFRVKKGDRPNLPESMSGKQRNLIKLMTKAEPSERVRVAFVVDKLSEIAREENSRDAAP